MFFSVYVFIYIFNLSKIKKKILSHFFCKFKLKNGIYFKKHAICCHEKFRKKIGISFSLVLDEKAFAKTFSNNIGRNFSP